MENGPSSSSVGPTDMSITPVSRQRRLVTTEEQRVVNLVCCPEGSVRLPIGQQICPLAGTSNGSDGTRTRDLRRDRLVPSRRRLATIDALSLYSCGSAGSNVRFPHDCTGSIWSVCCPSAAQKSRGRYPASAMLQLAALRSIPRRDRPRTQPAGSRRGGLRGEYARPGEAPGARVV